MLDRIKDMGESLFSYVGTINVDNKEKVERIMRKEGKYFHNGVLTIPESYEGKILYGAFIDADGKENITEVNTGSIKEIGDKAFEGCDGLTSVIMPEVTKIGENAFAGCSNLQDVQMLKITEIGKNVFMCCNNLTDAKINGVKTVEECAFNFCKELKNIEMQNVEKIDESAFAKCEHLTAVDIPNAIEIGKMAFSECCALKEVNIPNVRNIGVGIFNACNSLRRICVGDEDACQKIYECLKNCKLEHQVEIFMNDGRKWEILVQGRHLSDMVVEEDKWKKSREFIYDACPLCAAPLDNFAEKKEEMVVQLPCCENQFHKDCISKWLKNNKICPICQSDMTDVIID